MGTAHWIRRDWGPGAPGVGWWPYEHGTQIGWWWQAGCGVGKRPRGQVGNLQWVGHPCSGGRGLEDDKGRGLSDEQQALQRHVCPIRHGEDSSSVATVRGGARTRNTGNWAAFPPRAWVQSWHNSPWTVQPGARWGWVSQAREAVAQERVWGRRALWETWQKNSTRGWHLLASSTGETGVTGSPEPHLLGEEGIPLVWTLLLFSH